MRWISSETLIAVKTSQNCTFIVDQQKEIQGVLWQNLSRIEAKFEEKLYLNVEMKTEFWDQAAPCFKTAGGRVFFMGDRNILRFS